VVYVDCYLLQYMFGFDFFNHTFTSILFSNFLQGKQRLLYSLLDAMQSVSSQAVVLGISCRLVCALQLFPFFQYLRLMNIIKSGCFYIVKKQKDFFKFILFCFFIKYYYWLGVFQFVLLIF
jgi:hypothetical protein